MHPGYLYHFYCWKVLGHLTTNCWLPILVCSCWQLNYYIIGIFNTEGDKYRDISFQELLDLSLPFVEVSFDGTVCVAKTEGSGGVLDSSTCAQQLLYEVGDPSAYVTPDVVSRALLVHGRSATICTYLVGSKET